MKRYRLLVALVLLTGCGHQAAPFDAPPPIALPPLTAGAAPLLLRVAMDGGHLGQSGRFRRYRETAEQFAFLLNQLGVRNSSAPIR
jgi:hypothetical protein